MDKNYIFKKIVLIFPFVFFVFFALHDGPVLCKDSFDYINLTGKREPFYPLVIALLKILFKKNDLYLSILVLIQSLFLAYVVWKYVNYIVSKYRKFYLGIVVEIIFIFISLLCRFVAKRGSMYSNSILSEGLAYPLFLLFILYIYDYSNTNNKKTLFMSIILSLVLVLIRKQMYVSLFLIIISITYSELKKKNIMKIIINVLLSVLIVVGGSNIVDRAYMKIVFNENGKHTGDNRFIATMIFYTADKDDSKLIDDLNVRQLFESIYEVCEKNNYLYDKSITNWYDRVSHFNDNYDNIQIDTMIPLMTEYAKNNNAININKTVDEYNNAIIDSLLLNKLPDIFLVLIDSFLAGLMITVSADKPIFSIYAIIIYLIYIVLLLINIKKYKMDKTVIFSLLILFSIIINVGIISIVIFNQTRYTIYNMPLFYISLLLMIYNIFINKKIENRHEENK